MPNTSPSPVKDPCDPAIEWAILDGTLMMRRNSEERRTVWILPMAEITPERVALWHRLLHPPETPPALPLLYLKQAQPLREGTKVTLWSHGAGKMVIGEVCNDAEGADLLLSVPDVPEVVCMKGVTSRDGRYRILSVAGYRFPDDALGRVYQALSEAGFSTAHDAALLVQNMTAQRDAAIERERAVRDASQPAWKFAVEVREALGGAASADFDIVLGELRRRLAELDATREMVRARDKHAVVLRDSAHAASRFMDRMIALDAVCDFSSVSTPDEHFTKLGDIVTTWHAKAAHFDALRGALTVLLDA